MLLLSPPRFQSFFTAVGRPPDEPPAPPDPELMRRLAHTYRLELEAPAH